MPEPHEPTEDVSYSRIDDFAIEDDFADVAEEEGQTAETALIKEIRTYLDEAEAEHNTLDILDLTEQAKMTPTQQAAAHKMTVQHIRNIRNIINSKVKES